MVIRKEKVNKIIPVESNLMRISREMDKERKLAAEKIVKDAELKKKEYARTSKLIIAHLDSLAEQLQEKELHSFWAFPDRATFEKTNKTSVAQMEKKIKKNPKRYANRRVARIMICSHHDEKETSFYRKEDIWLTVAINIYQINDKADMQGRDNPSWGCTFIWETEDFKITKISLRLLERIMKIVATKEITCESLVGYALHKIIKMFAKKGHDLSDLLSPLAGV